MKACVSVVLLTAAALGAGASAQVVNGGFELPGVGFQSVGPGQTFGSWTCAGPSGIEFVHATPNPSLPGLELSAYEGSYWIDLVGVGSPSAIYQDLITSPGTMYEVSFAMAGNVWGGAQIMNMNVLWNGGNAGSFSHSTAGRTGADMGWTLHTVTVLGTGNDRLMFRATSGASAAGPALDAVSIRVVPAPASLALMGAGALFVGRRKR